jgi:hypothetical protein
VNFFSVVLILSALLFSQMGYSAVPVGECRPSMATAIERAKNQCMVWGYCKATIEMKAVILAEGKLKTPQEVKEETQRRMGERGSYDKEGVILLMSELGVLKLR